MFNHDNAWRGSIVVAKYIDTQYSCLVDASMSDIAYVEDWLRITPAVNGFRVIGEHHDDARHIGNMYFTTKDQMCRC